MKDRFIIVNNRERIEFEKSTHLSYGYNNCFITYNYEDAYNRFLELSNDDYIIEMITDKGIKDITPVLQKNSFKNRCLQ